jgi:hypothetical protein
MSHIRSTKQCVRVPPTLSSSAISNSEHRDFIYLDAREKQSGRWSYAFRVSTVQRQRLVCAAMHGNMHQGMLLGLVPHQKLGPERCLDVA